MVTGKLGPEGAGEEGEDLSVLSGMAMEPCMAPKCE